MSNQEKFFGTAREMMIGLSITVWIVLAWVTVESLWFPTNYSVHCFIVTPSGVVPTIQFDDAGVREKNGIVKGKTKLYRLSYNEACLIEEIKK